MLLGGKRHEMARLRIQRQKIKTLDSRLEMSGMTERSKGALPPLALPYKRGE